MLRVYPYKKGSKSASALAKALGIKQIKLENSKFQPREGRIILNWGATKMPDRFAGAEVINHPEDVARASNKLSFFQTMDGCRTVPWTDDMEVAKKWITEDKNAVVCRTILNGSAARGIVIADTVDELVRCKLYTKYTKKKSEYRIHIFDGKEFDMQQKVKRADVEEVDWRIRNHEGGFIFQRNDIIVPDDVVHQALESAAVSNLTFCAVDVLWNEHEKKAYVLEINTAPGLEGTTLDNYVKVFQKFV